MANLLLFDGLGRPLVSLDRPAVTTDRGLVVRPVLDGTTQQIAGAVTVSGGTITPESGDRLEGIDLTLREIKLLLEVALA